MAQIADALRRMPALHFRAGGVREVGAMALAGVDHQHVGPARYGEHGLLPVRTLV